MGKFQKLRNCQNYVIFQCRKISENLTTKNYELKFSFNEKKKKPRDLVNV